MILVIRVGCLRVGDLRVGDLRVLVPFLAIIIYHNIFLLYDI